MERRIRVVHATDPATMILGAETSIDTCDR